MKIISKIINAIKTWWANLPEDSSESWKIDKKIIKSIAFKLLVSIILLIVAFLTTFIAGLDTNNPLMLLVIIPFLKDIIELLKKIATDYNSKE